MIAHYDIVFSGFAHGRAGLGEGEAARYAVTRSVDTVVDVNYGISTIHGDMLNTTRQVSAAATRGNGWHV